MGNINNNEKNPNTNTFWVNPSQSDPKYIIPGMEREGTTGVTFPEASYKDGIEIPDKLVTINGAINYHLLDAININWDDATIPWATKITKWDGAGDLYEPNYEYNQPNEGGWTDGTIKETEDIVDILNYLIYRVVSHDFFIEHWNDNQLQPAILRLVNHRTDWYGGLDADIIDYDASINTADRPMDQRFSVKSNGLIINLYPYLVSNYWDDPNITSSYKTKLFDSSKNHRPGVVMCDTGWDEQRQEIYCGTDDRKIKVGGENFDIFEVETVSNSNQIKFISRNKHILDGYVQNSINVIEDPSDATSEGGVNNIYITTVVNNQSVIQTAHLYKLPIVAYKCLDGEKYPYTTFDVIKTLLRFGYAGIQDTIGYKEIKHSKGRPQFDPHVAQVTFGITIAKSQDMVDGYASDSKLYTVNIYKGDNTLKDFKLDKSEIISGQTRTFYDSHNVPIIVNLYKTELTTVEHESDYTDINIANQYKTEITFDAEFGPNYDALHNSTNEDIIKKSFVYPFFVVKSIASVTDAPFEYIDVCNSINIDSYKFIYDNSNLDTKESFILFENHVYGKITYEKHNNTWKYFYYPPAKEYITFDDGEYKLKLYGLMYYKINDVTTNRLLNPLWAELNITIKE